MGVGSMGYVVRAMASSDYERVQAHGPRVYEAQLLLHEARLELRECYNSKFVLGTDACFMRVKRLEGILLQELEDEVVELEAKKAAANDVQQASLNWGAAVENSARLSQLRLRDRGKDLAFSAAPEALSPRPLEQEATSSPAPATPSPPQTPTLSADAKRRRRVSRERAM